jgi:hypothetical protein
MSQLAAKGEGFTAWKALAWIWTAAGAAVLGGFLFGYIVDVAIDGRWDELTVRQAVLGPFFGFALVVLSAGYLLVMISDEVKLAFLPRLALWGSAAAAGIAAAVSIVYAGVFFAVMLVVAVYVSLRVPSGLATTKRSAASRRELLEQSSRHIGSGRHTDT